MPKKEKVLGFLKEYLPLIPLIFAVGVIPLIVRIEYYDPGLAGYSWFPDENHLMDMFMYWKNKAMMQLDAILILGYIYLAIKKQFPKEKMFIPLGIYTLLVVLSSVFSEVPEQTWNGFYGMMESAFAVFGYCLICYYAYAVVKNEKQLKVVMIALFVGVAVLGAIGLSQFLEHDFYMSDFGKDLIFPSVYDGYKEGLHLAFEKGRVYTSLYNPNYVGFYGCLLFPFFIVLSFAAKEKRQSIVSFVLGALVLVCVVGAQNKTAVILFVPMMIFVGVYFGKNYWKQMFITFAAALIVFVACNIWQDENTIVDQVTGQITQGTGTEENITEETVAKLESIHLNDENFTVVYNKETLFVKYIRQEDDSWKIEVKNQAGEVIPSMFNEEETGFCLANERYKGLEFIFGADEDINVGFSVTVGKESYFVYYSVADETYYHTNGYGKRAKIFASETFESPFFQLMGGFSGRGYIWSKSIPILKETLIIGSGPDTYAFMFPQYDYVSLTQGGWTTQLITKPHSMYLQMGIQTGVLSLIAFLIFYIGYFIQSLKLYWQKDLSGFATRCGAAIWIGSICYMMSAALNDSTIGVSIIYWTLLGLGYACNRIAKNTENIA